MALGAGVPGEDEFALGHDDRPVALHGLVLPQGPGRLRPLPDLPGRPREEVARWGDALTMFLKKLTLRHGRPLVLKSPPHTARIRLLLGLFPDARFVHIHRDPYEVFRSTRHMIRAVQPLFHLRECPPPDGGRPDPRRLHRDVRRLLRAAGADPRGPALRGRLRGPGAGPGGGRRVGLRGPGFAGFEGLRPRLENYLASIAGYRKNRHDDLPEPLRLRIAHEWGRSFDEWGYGR